MNDKTYITRREVNGWVIPMKLVRNPNPYINKIIKSINFPPGKYDVDELLEFFKFDMIAYNRLDDNRFQYYVYQYMVVENPLKTKIERKCDENGYCYTYSDPYLTPDFHGYYIYRVFESDEPIEFSDYMALKPIEVKSAHKRK